MNRHDDDDDVQQLQRLISTIADKAAEARRGRYRLNEGPSKINEMIYIGGYGDATDVGALTSLGITHVLNCANKDVRTGPAFYGSLCHYHGLAADDVEDYGILNLHMKESFDFISHCRENNGKILIHCMAGMNRSVTIAAAFMLYESALVDEDAFSLQKVVSTIASSRGYVLCNDSFCRELLLLENEYKSKPPTRITSAYVPVVRNTPAPLPNRTSFITDV
jgi:hypothetical protein